MRTQTPGRTAPATPAAPGEGLRERKKRLMRQQLSDTATRMFLDRGFDAVRVAEVAETCGVSEKTVFNYFPTKESLLLDRLEATVSALRTGLADPDRPPVQAALQILDRELVTADVRHAARLLETGLRSYAAPAPPAARTTRKADETSRR